MVDFVIRTERLTEGIQELLREIMDPDFYYTFVNTNTWFDWGCQDTQNTSEFDGLSDRNPGDIKSMYDWLETHHTFITDSGAFSGTIVGRPLKRSSSVRADLDKRFQRECNAMGYTFDGPTDDAIFLDISGLRYHVEEDRLEILYPVRPCTIKFTE